MQAIVTKYYPMVGKRSSRIQAKCDGKTTYTPYDLRDSAEKNHRDAANLLAESLGWLRSMPGGPYKLVPGWLPTPRGKSQQYVFVLVKEESEVVAALRGLLEFVTKKPNRTIPPCARVAVAVLEELDK